MTDASNLNAVREAFYAELGKQNMAPLWSVLSALVPPEPPQNMRGALWRYDNAREYLMRAGEIISAEEAERRVLILENPSALGEARTTQTLYAGLQLILPGEIAPCHRHTQSALRFVIEGEGAYTAVDGEKAFMSPFDLILTPAGAWHDHGNPSASPTIWLDGLDIPMVSAFGVGFAEKLPDERAQHPETRAPGETIARHGAALRLVEDRPQPRANPLFHYPYAMWRDALLRMAERVTRHASSGVTMEFVDPRTGESASPTMAAFCQFLPAAFKGVPERSVDSRVYVVVEGKGRAVIGEETFALDPRAIVASPTYTARALEAETDMILFHFSDAAALRRLSFWRR